MWVHFNNIFIPLVIIISVLVEGTAVISLYMWTSTRGQALIVLQKLVNWVRFVLQSHMAAVK